MFMALLSLQYQNCLRKFYNNTDSQILLYLARTHYEAEQWQECKKTLLRAIHLAPSNYILRFDAGVAMQKFSASTLQKTKRTVDEVMILLIVFVFCFLFVAPRSCIYRRIILTFSSILICVWSTQEKVPVVCQNSSTAGWYCISF